MSIKNAVSPVSDYSFQALMSKIGYERWADDPNNNSVTYKLKKDAQIPHLQPIVTVARPDYNDPRSGGYAYEKHYVVDLISSIIGDVDNDTAHATYAAIRELN